MDEPYRIEVLHIVNPHVIFIESKVQKNKPVIEQIGLYGVLPVNKTIDIDGEIQVERCENWPIAANTILREVLADKKCRLYFVPMDVDDRSTIFDDNIYKFGDIIVESRKNISAIDYLVDTAVAVKDEQVFQDKLSTGSLKLKLNTTRTEEVLNAIKKYYKQNAKVDYDWEETLNKRTVLHQNTKKITAELTEENLKLLDKTAPPIRDIRKVIELKERDLEFSREANLVSIGRGSRRQSHTYLNTPSKTSSINDRKSPKDINYDLKMILEAQVGGRVDNTFHKSKTEDRMQHSTPKADRENSKPVKSVPTHIDEDEWDDIPEKNELLPDFMEKDEIPLHKYCEEFNSGLQHKVTLKNGDYQNKYDNQENQTENQFNTEQETGKCLMQNNLGKRRNNKENYDKTREPEGDEVVKNHKIFAKNMYDDDEGYQRGDSKKSAPVKGKERCIVYCPDMELSSDNLKRIRPIKVSETCKENYANTEELIASNNKQNDEVFNTDGQFTVLKDVSANLGSKLDNFGTEMDESYEKIDEVASECMKNDDLSLKTDNVTSKGNVVSQNVIKKTGLTNKSRRLNISQLQEKIFALNLSRKEANDSVSSKSDLSSDQVDNSWITNLKEDVPPTEESHFASKIKSNEIHNHGSEGLNSKSCDGENIKKSSRVSSSSVLQARLQLLKSQQNKNETTDSNSDTSAKDSSSTDLPKETVLTKVEPKLTKIKSNQTKTKTNLVNPMSNLDSNVQSDLKQIHSENLNKIQRNVNPFKNLEGSKSVFVEKLVSPTLMVHTKNDNLILPKCELRDIPFKADTRMMLKAMHIQKPKRLQTVTWSYILRGHSMFIIGPTGNGKTLGYVPAICNLISDARTQFEGVGPICIIVCGTALSVFEIENLCKRFLSVEEKIVSFYPGIDTTKVITDLLNGCHLLICTAPALVSLLETDFGVDLRRLSLLVFDDCERLSQVYDAEINKITKNVNLMLKTRADKALKVQYVVASRQWCDFMAPLAKKAPDTVIAIGASQECVLYSKTHTYVNVVNSNEKKMDTVLEFLEEIDFSKRTVIVCREDEEVDMLAVALKDMRYTVFSCNNSMNLHDLYKLSETWNSYKEPISGPILVCCDGNLTHLNITNANYLVHYSLPSLFSMFCKRFFVLNENYASIFAQQKTDVKIKILMDKANVEQLPKILNFVKRCTNEELSNLDVILEEVMKGKDFKKAEILSPICNNMLMLGECVDVWNCSDRHTVFEKFDEPKEWMPRNGAITFKITHFDSAVTYSARVMSVTTKSDTTKLPNNLNTLALKMGMYYSKEKNRKLHGTPKVGDICAVASQQSLFERCRVLKVIPKDRKNAYHVLINLLDKEQMTIVTDVELYYIPEDLKAIETYVVKVRLSNIKPKDKDVTFSVAAKEHLQKLTELDRESGLYMRGQVVMSLGNCIFVETAEACVDLSTMGETVVKRDFKKELMCDHAEINPEHMDKLKKLVGKEIETHVEELKNTLITKKCPKWAHLDKEFSSVIFAAIVDASTIFLRLTKFLKVIKSLQKDIQVYAEKAPKIVQDEIYVGNIVLAEFSGDKQFERARIEEVIDEKKVKCFFVDNGDWRQVTIDKLKPISDNLLYRIPFQAIECRLVGVKPPGTSDWPEFSTFWLDDNCFEDKEGNSKELFVKYFTKEPASATGGHKYGVVVIDTSSDEDVVINKMMIELNLAKEIEEELKFIDEPFDLTPLKATDSSSDNDDNNNYEAGKETPTIKDMVPIQNKENYDCNDMNPNILFGKPIRSVPLIDSDNESDVSDKWDVNVDKDMLGFFGQPSKMNTSNQKVTIREVNYAPSTKTGHKLEKPCTTNVNTNTSKRTDQIDVPKNQVNISGGNNDNNSSFCYIKKKNQTPSKLSLNSDDLEVEDARTKSLLNVTEKSCTQNIKSDKDSKDISKNDTLDSDDLSSVANDSQTNDRNISVDLLRKPKVVWRQTKNTVAMKIILIGVEDYELEIKDRHIKFETRHNDIQYAFEFDLYGAILPQKCVHSNKGQYIQVSLAKLLPRNWLNLAKDFSIKKWITYDVDALEFSSDDDDEVYDDAQKAIKYNHEKEESASEEEDMMDDVNFTYKRH